MNDKTQFLLEKIMRDKLPLTDEDGTKLKNEGYGPYLNGLMLKFGTDKVLMAKGIDRHLYLTVLKETGSQLHYLTFKLTGKFEIDRVFLEGVLDQIDLIFITMTAKQNRNVQVEEDKIRLVH